MHNHSKIDFRSVRVVYSYDKDITDDSAKRAFDYLDRQLKKR
jgi:hypothetical protein